MVTAELSPRGDRIWLRFPYSPDLVQQAKSVPGASWSRSNSVWSYPLNIETCLLLRKAFGNRLKVGIHLAVWYRAAKSDRERLHAIATGDGVKLQRVPRVAPTLYAALATKPWQPSGVRFAADGKKVLVADEPGLGKTLVGMGAVVESGVPGPYLVVCPKTAVESVWRRELLRWLHEMNPAVVTVPDGRSKREGILDGFVAADPKWLANAWLVIHPAMVRVKSWWVCGECGAETEKNTKMVLDCGHDRHGAQTIHEHEFPQLFQLEWGAVIVDESDRALIKKVGKVTQTRNGAEMLRIREDGLAIAMSGTPLRGKPQNLWSTLNWLRPKEERSRWNWIRRFWKLGGYSGWEIQGLISPEHEQMLWDSLKGTVIRRTKQEVAKWMPVKTYVGSLLYPENPDSPVGIWLPMEGKQAKAYNEMRDQTVAALEGGTLSAIGTLALRTRLQQLAISYGKMSGEDFVPSLPSNKFDWLLDALYEWGFPEDPYTKVVVTSRFRQVLELFSRELKKKGIDSLLLTGKVTGARRAAVIDQFNDKSLSPDVMLLQHETGGVAITIDSADKMVMLDESDIDTMRQVEDRIHRVSNPRPVEYYYLRSIGTVDVGIALSNADGLKETTRLLDERRGVEYLRQILELSRG